MYYSYDGIKIYYEMFFKNTNKRNILILPGWGDTRKTFYNMINYFKNNYNIYIIDYPSFGNSKPPNKDLTIYDYAKLIKNFLIDLNIINPIIIAHSFGGRIATILTGLYKYKIDKMIFIDIAGIKPRKNIIKKIKEKIYKLLKYLCIHFFKRTKDKKINYLRKIFGSKDYNSLNSNMYNTFKNIVNEDLKKYYKNIESEVLIMWGCKDKDTPIYDAKYIEKHIKNSDLVIFKDGTHFVYLEYIYQINVIIDYFITKKDA